MYHLGERKPDAMEGRFNFLGNFLCRFNLCESKVMIERVTSVSVCTDLTSSPCGSRIPPLGQSERHGAFYSSSTASFPSHSWHHPPLRSKEGRWVRQLSLWRLKGLSGRFKTGGFRQVLAQNSTPLQADNICIVPR